MGATTSKATELHLSTSKGLFCEVNIVLPELGANDSIDT